MLGFRRTVIGAGLQGAGVEPVLGVLWFPGVDVLGRSHGTRGRALRRSGRHGSASYDWAGRGSTPVWRARRRVDLEYFEDWSVERSGTVQPPA